MFWLLTIKREDQALFLGDKTEELDIVVGIQSIEDLQRKLQPRVCEYRLGQVLYIPANNN